MHIVICTCMLRSSHVSLQTIFQTVALTINGCNNLYIKAIQVTVYEIQAELDTDCIIYRNFSVLLSDSVFT